MEGSREMKKFGDLPRTSLKRGKGQGKGLSYKNVLWRDINKQKYLLIMLWPAVIWLLLFCYAPLFGVVIAFKDYNPGLGILRSSWVGFKHFEELLKDPYMLNALRNTIMFSVLNLVLAFPFPIIFALLINEVMNMRAFKKVIQTVSYLPHFLSWAFVASFLGAFLSETGTLNGILKMLGIRETGYAYLANAGSYIATIIITNIWKGFGFGSIIYLAAMASIDNVVYEAAVIDGANRWQKILHITFPSIKPTITVLIILNISGLLNSNFEQFFLIRNALVSEIARVVDVYTYTIGFEKARFSYGTAVGLFKSVVSMLLLLIANFSARKLTDESIF